MSLIFDFIAQCHAPRRWGSILDAGTGVHSMRWLAGLDAERVVGVTGSEQMALQVRDAISLGPRHEVLVGNWRDPRLLLGQRFDVVLADYLIGAVDAFAPYAQDEILARLRRRCRGRLYVTGLEPNVIGVPRAEAGRLIWRLGRLRDACMLLAGDAPYREFPLDWTVRHLERADFRVIDTRRVPIRFGTRFVASQMGMIRDRIGCMPDESLRPALLAHAEALEAEALSAVERLGGLRHGSDYVVVAEVA